VTFGEDEAVHYEAWYETPEGRRADELEKTVLGQLLQGFSRPGSVAGAGMRHGPLHPLAERREIGSGGIGPLSGYAGGGASVGWRSLGTGRRSTVPFHDGAFDMMVFITTLEFLERPGEALVEALRV
jgi:hypothetical protein